MSQNIVFGPGVAKIIAPTLATITLNAKLIVASVAMTVDADSNNERSITKTMKRTPKIQNAVYQKYTSVKMNDIHRIWSDLVDICSKLVNLMYIFGTQDENHIPIKVYRYNFVCAYHLSFILL